MFIQYNGILKIIFDEKHEFENLDKLKHLKFKKLVQKAVISRHKQPLFSTTDKIVVDMDFLKITKVCHHITKNLNKNEPPFCDYFILTLT